jgi:hypothetical protein
MTRRSKKPRTNLSAQKAQKAQKGKSSDGRAAPRTFKYSEAEWEKIADSIKAMRERTPSDHERELLQEAGDDYQFRVSERASGRDLAPKKRIELFAKAARLCGQLSEVLQDAAESRYGERWRAQPAAKITRELADRLVVELLSPFHEVSGGYRQIMNFGSAVDLLAGLRSGCEDTIDHFYWAMNLNVSFTGRVDPAVIYYQRVLHICSRVPSSPPIF